MEGGNQMGTKNIFKGLFVISLTFILICLSVIVAGGLPNETPTLSQEIDYTKLKFEIVNKNITCEESLELLYSTKITDYYTYCKENMYIKWENGEIDTLEEALDENKVSIESLKDYDVEIIQIGKNEN